MIALEYDARGETPNQLMQGCELEKGLYAILLAYEQMLAWHKDGWFLGGISGDHILLTAVEWKLGVQFLDWSSSYVKKGAAFKRQMQFSIFKKDLYPDLREDQDADQTE